VRSLVLAWKLAEMEVARQEGEAPLFLMDDLGSELDPARSAGLVRLLRSIGAQIFVTTTDVRYLPEASGEEHYFRVEAGKLQPA
jgi:DNA replication and repair protein RecF